MSVSARQQDAPARPAGTLPFPTRMSLGAVVKGKLDVPLRIVLYGTAGVGKSTWAAGAPAPIYLGAEDGTSHLDVERFPQPETWQDVKDAVRVLTQEAHGYRTLVVDTLDWAEALCHAAVCREAGKVTIEDVGGGYGKGYVRALDEWRELLAAVDRLRATKRMTVVMLAHSLIRNFKNPAGDAFDRYEMKLHQKAAGVLTEWCDALLFAQYETLTVTEKGRTIGVGTGARVVHTQRTAAWEAKNRQDLPDVLPLCWDDFAEAVRAHRPADPAALAAEVRRKAALLGGEIEEKSLGHLNAKSADAAHLARLNDRLTALLAERRPEGE